ncbi:hypothetical protein A3B42_01950 [Candidatus Daviesbacteria bacterium RIFCSPLOWO2_01_FULL_38_10]|uniref:DNA polymerase III delta N-terminal domain-containing protein n=1 Tax=Candidatus Daviesbacteria bacterium GW2011_GWF2_38_6 TaxID=1618432 RepID=A0A0G0NIK3_9BACT|nr:MAG: hypothetical protein US80_C0015G0008 [Candidatus Daviesbacteria bacterium GW2011_GWA2_38_17]KKQ76941.1 MAG: hypothetical protein US99_C0054G0002 [Candidatus Daviesbacteria bacterium GW2011_GWF2_38_6]OGE38005.1 MAG: hypothetical protein A3B42_01950 [Candidatus Daviesbacteria bacterium RIFCSPLOWO2_01_FULL_38_10]OGE45658.1 MAG: hypothetical protein A3E67_02710 [Candidatus Daviesbacteria bacterium RIFCSPHIGHO2_12_FULL_38_25]OGE67180.1 MAG: hypothetical protein A3H81_04120 [Candidatus Davies
MNLLLLHGPAINSSRQKLLQLKQKFDPEAVVVFEKGAELTEILTNLQSQSLFGEERLVIVENPPDDYISTLSLVTSHLSLVIWFDHEVDTKNFQGEIFFFPEAKEISVFPFLDFLGNRDKRAYLELDKLKQNYDSQYLITMILYLLRNLNCTPKNAKDFVKKKNERMRKNFSADELANLYQLVLNTDFKIKSGLLEIAQAEFLLVNLFLD